MYPNIVKVEAEHQIYLNVMPRRILYSLNIAKGKSIKTNLLDFFCQVEFYIIQI